jgi:DNA-binding NarL/FixJ family response regulator
MIRVLIVDDHPIFRQGIKLVLSEASDIEIAGEASSGIEALAMLRRQTFDVATLDLSMIGMGGLETLKQIRYEQLPVAVIILTIHPEKQFAVRTLRAGADGYMTKTSVPDQLITAIRQVAGGGKFITPSIAEKVIAELNNPTETQQPHEKLSDREDEVFRLIGKGMTVGDIGRKLNISVKTVSTHRAHILKKMGMETNAQLMHYAISNHLVE